MTDQKMNIYEGLFLFPQAAAGNLQGALDHVTELLDRAGAETLHDVLAGHLSGGGAVVLTSHQPVQLPGGAPRELVLDA